MHFYISLSVECCCWVLKTHVSNKKKKDAMMTVQTVKPTHHRKQPLCISVNISLKAVAWLTALYYPHSEVSNTHMQRNVCVCLFSARLTRETGSVGLPPPSLSKSSSASLMHIHAFECVSLCQSKRCCVCEAWGKSGSLLCDVHAIWFTTIMIWLCVGISNIVLCNLKS